MSEATDLGAVAQKIRLVLDARHAAREETLPLSREIIRNCANSIRAAHRGELETAAEMLVGVRASVERMRLALQAHPDIYGAGYVHDCQKEFAEASAFLAILSGRGIPDPDDVGVEYPAYLNGLGETVGELRRHTLDAMRHRPLEEAERLLAVMDEIYHMLVTIDYPDALTNGLRRTTDVARGIIEKTRGELTVALRQDELRRTLREALDRLGGGELGEVTVEEKGEGA